MSQGPNVRKLIVHKMSLDAVPVKSATGLTEALGFLGDKGRIINSANNATIWVRLAIKTVREASGSNPWKHADDEEIAAVILDGIAEIKARTKR